METISMTFRNVTVDEEPGEIVRAPAITNAIPHQIPAPIWTPLFSKWINFMMAICKFRMKWKVLLVEYKINTPYIVRI